MKIKSSIQIALLLVVTGACTSLVFNYQVAENVDFEEFETFAILPDNDTADFSVYNSDIVKDKTVVNIKEEMLDRGYKLDPENPDLLVKPYYMFVRETEKYYEPLYPSYDYYIPGIIITPWAPLYYVHYSRIPRIDGNGLREVKYTEGTIVVDVINAENNKLIWRGWLEDRINPITFTEDIPGYIDRIFLNYPLGQK